MWNAYQYKQLATCLRLPLRTAVDHHPEKSPNPPPFFFFLSCPNSIVPAAPADPPWVGGLTLAWRYLPTNPASSSSLRFRFSFSPLLSPLAPKSVPNHVVLSFSRSARASARLRSASSDWSWRARRALRRFWYSSNGSDRLIVSKKPQCPDLSGGSLDGTYTWTV